MAFSRWSRRAGRSRNHARRGGNSRWYKNTVTRDSVEDMTRFLDNEDDNEEQDIDIKNEDNNDNDIESELNDDEEQDDSDHETDDDDRHHRNGLPKRKYRRVSKQGECKI